jgi:hypothetical protein
MELSDLILIILVNILTLIVTFFIFYKRSKKLIYKYFDKSKKENQEFIKYVGNIENRLKKEIKVDKILLQTNNNLKNNNSENWALIVSFNRGELIKNLISDIKKFEKDIKIIVIDNGSKSDTINILTEMKLNFLIDLLILNTNNLTPQWQKSYAIYQGIELLKMREIYTLTIFDDDINVQSNWINSAKVILDTNKDIKIANFMNDDEQEKVHKTIEVREVNSNGTLIKFKVKETFNGAFFCLEFSTLLQMGYPPIAEGISDSSVEDWYYSRILKSNNWLIASLDHSKHLGYDNSIRESIGKE